MGSKSENLKKLELAGFRVPPFVELTSSQLTQNTLEEIVSQKFKKTTLFAVRSSAFVEDGIDKSYAGHFHSELGVPFCHLFKAYQKVSDSLNGFGGSVIIQEFIPSKKAGVLFTDNGYGLIVVNSNFGLCKTVVEGQACDEWYLSGERFKLIKKNIATNKKPLEFINNEITNIDTKSEASLTLSELNELATECKKIETYFGYPQDIEWCFYDEKLYILQSRPITRKLPATSFIYFDSANISESYSGIVLPLTHSFAIYIYQTVYKNLLKASGVSRNKIEKNQTIFRSLVAGFYGRMFYNMNSWYLMMSFLPGYKRNKKNLEKMLTMNVSEDIIQTISPSLSLKFRYPFIVIWKLIFFNHIVKKFEYNTRIILSNARKIDFCTYSLEECIAYYSKMQIQLLHNFHIPVENDFLLMTYFGILRKKYQENQLREIIAFDSVSSNQLKRLTSISNKLYEINEFKDAIETENIVKFQNLLKLNPEVSREIEDYFSLYSGRFANELKLESDDIERSDFLFFKLLKAYHLKEPVIKTKPQVKKGFLLNKFFKYARKREELRLLRSNCFSLVRRVFLRIGEIYTQMGVIDDKKDIFYCTLDEALNKKPNTDLKNIIEKRKQDYLQYKKFSVPSFFALFKNEMPYLIEEAVIMKNELTGRACNDGTIIGKIRVFKEFEMPNVIDFDIIVAKNTDPGWSLLIGLSKGMIIENGGILSHAAIVSRELGIPTIIGVEEATKILFTGQTVELNGATGTIKILKQ